MKRLPVIAAGIVFSGCSSIVHTPPHTSVEVALARKPQVVRLAESAKPEPRLTKYRQVYIPPVEPALPTNDRIEAVAEQLIRGEDALDSGNTGEAIKSLEEATRFDPDYTDAWKRLADAYEKAGQKQKSKDALQHYKALEKRGSVKSEPEPAAMPRIRVR